MNILIFSNCPLVESQGSGYVIINTAKSLKASGHQVEIIPPDSFSFLPLLKNKASIYRTAIGMALWMYRNRKSIFTKDLIIFYGAECSLALFVLQKIVRCAVPTILHSNGLEVHVDYRLKYFEAFLPLHEKWYHLDKSFLFRYCYRHVAAIITVSDYDRLFALQHLNISANKVYTLEPCLPEIFFNYVNTNISRKKIITYCGSWISRKGIESIKETIPLMLRQYPEYMFRIIGVGYDFKVSEHFPEDVLKQIELYPLVESKTEMIELYSESEILLFPSFCESFGLVIAEAMFCGCAVITGPTGIASTLINNEDAMVLEVPDATHVFLALEMILTDDVLKNRLSLNGKHRVEKLQWKRYTDKLEHVLSTVIIHPNDRI